MDLLPKREDGLATNVHAIEQPQRTAAKVVGFLYLFTNATAIFGYCLRGPLLVRGNAAQTVKNIADSERLYRISIVTDLLTVACVLILVLGLYTVLKPVNRNVALLALFWRLAENFILAIITLSAFATLALVNGGDYLRAFDAAQVQALVYTLAVRVHGAGFNIGFVFLGLGSTVFSYLWLKSRYIPRVLAAWGIFSSLLMVTVTLAIMIFPRLGWLGLTYMMPMGFYEFGLGFWLLIKGIKAPLIEGKI